MNEAQELNQRLLLTWPAPTGIAASDEASQAARINHYLATTKTKLGDGTSVIPNHETLEAILLTWDLFGIEVVISSNSYIVRK